MEQDYDDQDKINERDFEERSFNDFYEPLPEEIL